MRDREREFIELTQFFCNFAMTRLNEESDLHRSVKRIYKRHITLLIWKADLDQGSLWRSAPEKETLFRMYFSEAISDISQCFLLYYQGLYKPSRLLLRSAIENFIRCIGIIEGLEISEITNTYDLLDQVKKTPLITSNKVTKSAFN